VEEARQKTDVRIRRKGTGEGAKESWLDLIYHETQRRHQNEEETKKALGLDVDLKVEFNEGESY